MISVFGDILGFGMPEVVLLVGVVLAVLIAIVVIRSAKAFLAAYRK